jgi:hypothetical protein
MSYNLYLDDFRVPRDSYDHSYQPIYISLDWEIVRSYDEFVKIILEKGIPEVISFDHDLADAHYEQPTHLNYDECKEKTGYHCAKWLINYCIDNKKEIPAMILVHSLNPAGTLNIRSLFNTYYKYMRI